MTGTGQTAPKAKKLKGLNERLAAEGAGMSEDMEGDYSKFPHFQGEDWMKKMEAEWQHTNDINRLIAKEE